MLVQPNNISTCSLVVNAFHRAMSDCLTVLLNTARRELEVTDADTLLVLAELHELISACLLYTSPSPRDS